MQKNKNKPLSMLTAVLITAFIFLATSCVVQTRGKRLYDGALLPVKKVGLVRADKGIIIEEIDGKQIKANSLDIIELLPGEHGMALHVSKTIEITQKRRYSKEKMFIKLNVLPGNSYYIRLHQDRDSHDWIVISHNVTDWPEVGFLFSDYLKQRANPNIS